MNKTNKILLGLLREKFAAEPEAPNSETQTGSHLELVARTRDEWEREVFGLHALLGSRLINELLEQPEESEADSARAELDDVEIRICRSPEDGKYVVDVDTSAEGSDVPPVRIWLNDGLVHR
jgi:hypothetical protein